MKSNKIICFGEILWDIFEDGKKLGGAPFNVTNSLKDLGADVEFISRIGKDFLGNEILKELKSRGVSTIFLQEDPIYPTGKVTVDIDSDGSAKYEIDNDSAWDYIEKETKTVKMVSDASAFVFGSLIARAKSFEALNSFLKVSKFSIFDINLRPPFYNQSLLIDLMNKSDMLKFNDEELDIIANGLESPFNSIDKNIEFIAERTKTKIICVTKGKYGAVLYHHGDWFYNNGYRVIVKDSVGAGDSFLATLINGLIEKEPLQKTIDYACAMGALVANSFGANPTISKNDLESFIYTYKDH
jgi:fructokinase